MKFLQYLWNSCEKSIIISLEISSGIDATTGKRALNYVKPDATLTLALPKTGLLPEISGELFLAEIGIPLDVYKHLNINHIPQFGKDFIVKIDLVE